MKPHTTLSTGFLCLALMASACQAQTLTVAEAQELSRQTGRPILAVAGRKG